MKFNFFKKNKENVEVKEGQSEKIEVSIKYSYEWNEDVPEAEKDTPDYPSRAFCKKLLELNRLYTRSEIELISQRVGYSVWDRRGGEGCRHRWVSQTVVKKSEQ
ncbi:hypothetical protein [Terrimonas alba]|uniref:hypothetical protein n=1 Tax=Terrimonas alba TaxID=3349636 RepID=UPI0035F34443